ncbi:MAG: glucosidase family protein, partial [Limisphaerales bacterium]
MHTLRPVLVRLLPLALALMAQPTEKAVAQVRATSTDDPWTVDFRYAPSNWQTAICLPDDWQKTLVGKDGSLLYDYPGKFGGFGTRVTVGLAGESIWVRQELDSPRVPIVRTFKRVSGIEIEEEAFAVAPVLVASKKRGDFHVERIGSQTGQADWAAPAKSYDAGFRDVAIGFAQPIHYRFPAAKGARYTVVFGLCEGYHPKPGQRILDLQIEGRTRRVVDMVAEKGRNVPELFAFNAQDENGDGGIDVVVAAAANSPDANSILNVLWVFRGTNAPPLDELLAGQSSRPPLAHLSCGASVASHQPPRHDVVIVRLRNTSSVEAKAAPTLTIESESAITPGTDQKSMRIGGWTSLQCTGPFTIAEKAEHRFVLQFEDTTLAPGAQRTLAFCVARGAETPVLLRDVSGAEALRRRAARFWRKLDLPYDRLAVPDPGVQALLDSSIRNIFQAREIKQGLPAFQVGPTCYRGLWVVDGSFILESMTYLGRLAEVRRGVQYLMSFQREDGSFMLIDGHWKETGIALWAITRHARLTGDQAWLREAWPNVERGFAFIHTMRALASKDRNAPNCGLIPDGFSDGGLAGKVPEYTNIYWTLAGMRAAIAAARWLDRTAEANDWQREYDDFYQTFRRAAERDARTDAQGNRYVPIRMQDNAGIPPQKAQWGFLHAVFPGKVFDAADPLVVGNMAMLRAVEKQGLVLDTGWLKDGIWNYFASFYGHAWLWLGDGDKAVRTLYAFGNHASPLLVWREEQKPVGQGTEVVGDMPHNWASAEFIRLVRHLLVLERGNELHLLEGLPSKWVKPGAVIRLTKVATEFGPITLNLRVSTDGTTARLKLNPLRRTPERIVLHLDHWSGELGTIVSEVPLSHHSDCDCKRLIYNALVSIP